MNSCHGEAVEDACTSGDVSLPRHGSEVVFTSWESEGDSSPSPIMMAGVRTRYWEDDGDPFYRERLFQVFSKIDKDHDGSITRDELRQYCGDDQLEDAIKALDINQDGNISFEEFYACFKKVTPMLESLTPLPAASTPQNNMVTSYVVETGGEEDDALEWESIMKKFSIDSDSPLFQSKELRELIARMEHQSPHLLDTMEQVISFLHADWQQLKRDCDNLHNKLKRESHHTVEQAMEYDETLKEQLEKERETFVTKERQLKGRLEKQLREKEDYILQVLAQKRKLEEQLNVKEKEQVSLQQQNKELESVIKYKETNEREISHSARSTPLRRKHNFLTTAKSSESFDKKEKLTFRSNTLESCCSDHEESCDDAPVSFELSGYLMPSSHMSPSHVDHMPQKSKSAISLAEEFEQLDKQNDTHPVMLHLPSAEISHDSSSTHVTSDNVLPGDTSTEWSPLVGRSPLMSSSMTNSRQLTPSPYLESSDSRESPIPTMSHEHTQKMYRSHSHSKGSGSHEQQISPDSGSHDYQHRGSNDQYRGSHDHQHYYNGESHEHQHRGSHDQESHDQGSYDPFSMDSFSCPNLSTLESYGEKRHLQHFSNDGNSAIWDDRYHDNCASMSNIHLQSGTSRDRLGNRNTPSRRSFNGVSNILPSLVEESTSPSTLPPPSHVYKVVYLGNSGVGKSSVIRWLSTGSFRSATEATIGMDYITRTIVVDNEPVLLQLWDTAGQERFGPITAVYCRRADAFILVYDITSRTSFVGIKGWSDVIKATLRDESSVLLLIGNKRDVSHGDREVSTREGEKLAEQLGAIFMETSARSGNNVIKAHELLSRKLLEREDEIMNEAKMMQPPTVYIDAVNSLNKRKCFC